MRLVLASASPRRRELLAAAGMACHVDSVDVDERRHAGESAETYAVRVALEKARAGAPLDGYVGGRAFHNRERRLPAGRYREYDVHPRVAGRDRGPERLVIDQTTGRAYYTGDHYRTFVPLN